MDQPQVFLAAMNAFYEKGSVTRVLIADGKAAPNPLAFCVNFPSLLLVLRGRMTVELALKDRATTTELTGGQALLVPPNRWYVPEWGRGTTVLTFLMGFKSIGFSLLKTGKEKNALAQVRKLHTSKPLQGIPEQLLSLLLEAGQEPEMAGALPWLINGFVQAMHPLIATANDSSRGRAYQLYETVCLYLQKNGHNPALSRDSVAAEFAITPNHVSRLFQEQGAIRFSDYLSLVRVARAKFLLVSYDQTLAQIAAACGFQDLGYFCRVFKKYARMTPGQYRLAYARRRNKA